MKIFLWVQVTKPSRCRGFEPGRGGVAKKPFILIPTRKICDFKETFILACVGSRISLSEKLRDEIQRIDTLVLAIAE